MTASVSPVRWRADGSTYIRGGRLVLVLALVVFLLQGNGSSLPGLLAGFGEVGVIIGTYMVTTSGFLWTIPVGIVTVFCSSVGLNTAADAKALALSGQRVTCEVMAVTSHVSRTTEVDAYGRPRTRTHTAYRHTMRCPVGTYTVASGVREPVGDKLDMVRTRGDELEFSTSAEVRYGLGLASVGGLAALLLPLVVRSIERLTGRRRALRQRPAGPTGPPSPRASEPPFQDE
jgi:hypothetical protein